MTQTPAESIRALKELGFFARENEASALARFEAAHGAGDPGVSGVVLDQFVLALDETRVFSADAECDAMEGNHEWEAWAARLASLAGFRDAVATERWLPGDVGDMRVEITLRAGGQSATFLGRDLGDYVDVASLLAGVNSLLPPWGRRLRQIDTGDQTALIVLANAREARRLAERGLGPAQRDEPPESQPLPKRLRDGAAQWWSDFWAPFRRA